MLGGVIVLPLYIRTGGRLSFTTEHAELSTAAGACFALVRTFAASGYTAPEAANNWLQQIDARATILGYCWRYRLFASSTSSKASSLQSRSRCL